MRDTYPQIVKEYVDTGKIRYSLMDLPLESIHKLAFKAAEATRCAEDQDKYWEMHSRLFENQRSLEPWSGHAEALGLDVGSFEECMTSGKHSASIVIEKRQLDVDPDAQGRLTPIVLVGRPGADRGVLFRDLKPQGSLSSLVLREGDTNTG